MPKDGYPIVGFHDQIKGLYIAVMHSTITLSPVISKLIAKEIVDKYAVGRIRELPTISVLSVRWNV